MGTIDQSLEQFTAQQLYAFVFHFFHDAWKGGKSKRYDFLSTNQQDREVNQTVIRTDSNGQK
jgi:hypothetical protein